MTSRRTFIKGALAAAPAIALAGCGRSTSGPAARGTVTIGTAMDLVNFDPYSQTSNALMMLRPLNGWLANYDEQLRASPDVLESFTIARDRASVTLRIRQDVRFATGRIMDVEDVVFALERAADPKRGFNLASGMSIVEGVSARDAREVVIRFKQPTSPTLITDLLVGQPILDRNKNTSEALAGGPAGAGPYRLMDWRQGESLTLEADPHWYRGRARTGRIVIKVFSDPTAVLSGLESGQLDVAAYVPAKDARRMSENFAMMSGYPGAATMLLRVNTKTRPYDNRVLRQAIQHAVNRERIAGEVMFGFGSAATLPWGPKSAANDRAFYDRARFDLGQARRLFDAAGAPGAGTAMVDGSDRLNLLVMQVIQADLAKLGFDLRIEKVDTAAFQSRLAKGEFGVVLGQMGAGQLSLPRVVQNSLFRLSGNPLWPGGIPPQRYIDGMRKLIGGNDPSAYREINESIVEEAWAIGTYYVPTLYAAKRDLRGLARDHQNSLVLNDVGF